MILALRTNTFIWKSPLNKYIDDILSKSNVHLIDLPWHLFTRFKTDPNHFTWKGYKNFCKHLKLNLTEFLETGDKIHIISDSTIGFWQHRGSKYLKQYFKEYKVTVDAICGSGYHSYPRFDERILNVSHYDKLIIIGGWNDNSFQECRTSINNITSKI